jgi:hypothetical protein
MDEATVTVVQQYLHNTSADVATVAVVLQYLHSISPDVATVFVVVVVVLAHYFSRFFCGCTALFAQYFNASGYFFCSTALMHNTKKCCCCGCYTAVFVQ